MSQLINSLTVAVMGSRMCVGYYGVRQCVNSRVISTKLSSSAALLHSMQSNQFGPLSSPTYVLHIIPSTRTFLKILPTVHSSTGRETMNMPVGRTSYSYRWKRSKLGFLDSGDER